MPIFSAVCMAQPFGCPPYSDPFVIFSPAITENRTEIYQNVTYETIYNVTNETTNIYQTMPEEDLSDATVAPVPQGVDFSVGDISTDLKSGSLEVEEAPSETREGVLLENNPTVAYPQKDQAPDIPEDETPPTIPSLLEKHSNDGHAGAFADPEDMPVDREDSPSDDYSTHEALPWKEGTDEPPIKTTP